jgi:hypothetical protein
MKKILIIAILISSIFANEFIPNKKCKSCHNNIYEEYLKSSHFKSTVKRDKIHKAVFDKSGKPDYKSCSKCHTPTGFEEEAVSCSYCHRIKSIEHGKNSNNNITTNTLKEYFGKAPDNSKSPFHKIITTNEEYKNANICLGCHSHKNNANGLSVCQTKHNNNSNQNCISCHMPQVAGTKADDVWSKTHSFHGFSGANNRPKLLEKYIDLEFVPSKDGFRVFIDNKSPHDIMLQPLRVAVLKVYINNEEFQTLSFNKVFDKSPAHAKKIISNTTIKANEKRELSFTKKLKKDDKVRLVFGYYLVNPKMIDKLGLTKNYKARKFYKLKTKEFKY